MIAALWVEVAKQREIIKGLQERQNDLRVEVSEFNVRIIEHVALALVEAFDDPELGPYIYYPGQAQSLQFPGPIANARRKIQLFIRDQASKAMEGDWEGVTKKIESEEFLDKIIARIIRKQLPPAK